MSTDRKPSTGETVRSLPGGASKPLLAGLLGAFVEGVGAGFDKRSVRPLDSADFHTRPDSAVPDGIGSICGPRGSPDLQPAEPLWPRVDEPLVEALAPSLDRREHTIGERYRDLIACPGTISSRRYPARRPESRAPASSHGDCVTPTVPCAGSRQRSSAVERWRSA